MTPILCWFVFKFNWNYRPTLGIFPVGQTPDGHYSQNGTFADGFFADYNPATLPKYSAVLITAVQEFDINKNVFHKSQKIIKTKNPVGTSDSEVWGDKGRW